jgi:hypothetical protein
MCMESARCNRRVSTSAADTPDTDRDTPRDVRDVLVDQGKMEVVATASGEVLYVLQRLDD